MAIITLNHQEQILLNTIVASMQEIRKHIRICPWPIIPTVGEEPENTWLIENLIDACGGGSLWFTNEINHSQFVGWLASLISICGGDLGVVSKASSRDIQTDDPKAMLPYIDWWEEQIAEWFQKYPQTKWAILNHEHPATHQKHDCDEGRAKLVRENDERVVAHLAKVAGDAHVSIYNANREPPVLEGKPPGIWNIDDDSAMYPKERLGVGTICEPRFDRVGTRTFSAHVTFAGRYQLFTENGVARWRWQHDWAEHGAEMYAELGRAIGAEPRLTRINIWPCPLMNYDDQGKNQTPEGLQLRRWRSFCDGVLDGLEHRKTPEQKEAEKAADLVKQLRSVSVLDFVRGFGKRG